MSFVLPSVQAREGNRVTWQTQWWGSYVFTNKRGCVTMSSSLTHIHTTRKLCVEQSITNTLTNNKTFLQLLIQKRQIIRAKLEFTQFFGGNSLHAQPALYSPRFTKLSSIKCVQIRTSGLCCSFVNNLNDS